MNILNTRQQKLAAAAVSVLSGAVLVAGALGVVWLLSLILDHLSGVILPPLTAAILALVMKPYYDWLLHRLDGRRVVASLVVLASLAVPLAVFLGVFGSLLVQELVDLMRRIPAAIEAVNAAIRESWPQMAAFLETHDMGRQMRGALEKQGSVLAKGAGQLGIQAIAVGANLFRSVAAAFSWAVFPVYFFFFNMAPAPRPAQLDDHLGFLSRRTRGDAVYLGQEFVNILVSFFRGQLVIALIQGGLFAVGFSLVGLSHGFALGLILGLLNIVPYLGNMLGLLICLPLAFFQPGGGWPTMLAVIVVILVVQMIEGYFLTPKIMGDRTGLHPAVIIFALFFWGTVFNGIAGMILAIPLTAFLVILWRLVRRQYLPREGGATQPSEYQ